MQCRPLLVRPGRPLYSTHRRWPTCSPSDLDSGPAAVSPFGTPGPSSFCPPLLLREKLLSVSTSLASHNCPQPQPRPPSPWVRRSLNSASVLTVRLLTVSLRARSSSCSLESGQERVLGPLSQLPATPHVAPFPAHPWGTHSGIQSHKQPPATGD